jgi:hypothetical protein
MKPSEILQYVKSSFKKYAKTKFSGIDAIFVGGIWFMSISGIISLLMGLVSIGLINIGFAILYYVVLERESKKVNKLVDERYKEFLRMVPGLEDSKDAKRLFEILIENDDLIRAWGPMVFGGMAVKTEHLFISATELRVLNNPLTELLETKQPTEESGKEIAN